MSVLCLSYDGVLEPLGQSQVLRYMERLALDQKIVLISFEKPHDWLQIDSRKALRNQIRTAGNSAAWCRSAMRRPWLLPWPYHLHQRMTVMHSRRARRTSP